MELGMIKMNSRTIINPKGQYYGGNDMHELQKSEAVSVSRRAFCKKAIKRSSVTAAVGIAGYLVYRKPAIKSFFGASDAYAASTGAGKFSLKGDSN
jgi:hypothetical protein